MNFLKTISILLLIIILVLGTIGFIQPKTYLIKRNTEIKAPLKMVYKEVSYWENWENWSPWVEYDTAMFVKIDGEDGKEGSRYNWKSENPEAGTGNMIFTKMDEKRIGFSINLQSPFKFTHDAAIEFKENVLGNTLVTWTVSGESGFFERIASIFWNMDAMVGPDMEKGLENLKQLVENKYKMAGYIFGEVESIEEMSFANTSYLTSPMKVVSFTEIAAMKDYKEEVQELMAFAFEKNLIIIGAHATLIYKWDTLNKEATMAIGLPLSSGVDTALGYPVVEIKATPGTKYSYIGKGASLPQIMDKLEKHLFAKGLKQTPPAIFVNSVTPIGNLQQEKEKVSVIYLHE